MSAKRLVGAACGLWIAALTAGAQMSPDQAYELQSLRGQLLEANRVPVNLARAANLVEAVGGALDTARARELLFQMELEPIAEKRRALAEALQEELVRLADRLAGMLPPLFAADVPNDDGGALFLSWEQPAAASAVTIERRTVDSDEDEYEEIRTLRGIKAGRNALVENAHMRPGHAYQYRVSWTAADAAGGQLIGETEPVEARGNWFNTNRTALFFVVLVMSAAVIFYIGLARGGADLKIRKIAGLEAVDEAVGRATEMGRPIMFVPGIQDMNDIQTVAGITVLGRVARTAAQRDALLEVPTSRSLVMTAARETVQASCLDVGRPDAYDEKKIYYTTDEQFGYVAAVTGAMVREQPATCFYMGAFFAESLILAETANMCGAIQIAGTAMPAQLPFFVAACDYTLIGEEFFAASAYLSGEPAQLGSLKGQDMGKIFGLFLIVLGVAAVSLYELMHSETAYFISDFVTQTVLNTADQ